MKSVKQEAGQFFMVAIFGLIVDISLAWCLTAIFGMPLLFAAATGFLVATVFNYLMNSAWTFFDCGTVRSVGGFLAYLGTVLTGLGVRLALLWVLQRVVPAPLDHDIILLAGAAGASFVVNFFLAKRFVFNSGGAED